MKMINKNCKHNASNRGRKLEYQEGVTFCTPDTCTASHYITYITLINLYSASTQSLMRCSSASNVKCQYKQNKNVLTGVQNNQRRDQKTSDNQAERSNRLGQRQ